VTAHFFEIFLKREVSKRVNLLFLHFLIFSPKKSPLLGAMHVGHFFDPLYYFEFKFWPIGNAERPHGRLSYWK